MTVAPPRLPTTPVRLAKRVAELKPCSRSEAERLIEGGWVRVDGQVVEVPAHKVLNEAITIDPQATAIDLGPVTFVLHKPPGYEAGLGQATAGDPRGSRSRGGPSALACLTASAHAGTLPGGQPVRLLQKHFRDLVALAPLPTQASGLAVFSQDWRVQRKLTEDADLVEQEVMVVAGGEVTPRPVAAPVPWPEFQWAGPAPHQGQHQQPERRHHPFAIRAQGHPPWPGGFHARICGVAHAVSATHSGGAHCAGGSAHRPVALSAGA